MGEMRLSDWARSASLEDKYDVIMQLAVLAASNTLAAEDPSCVLVDDDCKVRCTIRDGETNIAWQAPEIIEAVEGNDTERLKSMGSDQLLYMVGLMAYWLLTGNDYYLEHGLSAATIHTLDKRRSSVMRRDDLASITPLADALSKWTSIKPERRKEGTDALFGYLTHHVPGTVRLVYTCNGNRVHTEDRAASGPVSLEDGETVEAHDGSYKVAGSYSFPYRPGTHSYVIKCEKMPTVVPGKVLFIPKSFQTGRNQDSRELVSFLDLRGGSVLESITLKMSYPDFVFSVMQYDSDGRSSNLGTVRVAKPAGYGGTEYVLTLLYDAGNHVLYARFEDTLGHMLDARNLGNY